MNYIVENKTPPLPLLLEPQQKTRTLHLAAFPQSTTARLISSYQLMLLLLLPLVMTTMIMMSSKVHHNNSRRRTRRDAAEYTGNLV